MLTALYFVSRGSIEILKEDVVVAILGGSTEQTFMLNSDPLLYFKQLGEHVVQASQSPPLSLWPWH